MNTQQEQRQTLPPATALDRRLCEYALYYAQALRWPVFPCCPMDKQPLVAGGFKSATTDETTIRKWWKQWPRANIGMPTGQPSGVVVIDVDPRNGGLESFDQLADLLWNAPDIPTCDTGGGGQHYYFAWPGQELRCRTNALGPGIDLRADGGYVILPPSLHPSGNRYLWRGGSHPSMPSDGLPSLPDELLQRVQRAQRWSTDANETVSFASDTATKTRRIPAGQRNTTLTRIAGALRRHGAGLEAILAALREVNKAQCDPPLEDEEVQRIARSVARYSPAGAVNGAHADADAGAEVEAEVEAEAEAGAEAPATAKQTLVARVVAFVDKNAELFHDKLGEAYSRVWRDGHIETLPVRGGAFRGWLANQLFELQGLTPSGGTLSDAMTIIEHRARTGPEYPVYVRTAPDGANGVYIDLGGPGQRAIHLTPAGWRLVDQPSTPARFLRPAGMSALPEPVPGGSVDELRRFVNVASDDDFALLMAFLRYALLPFGPYPILILKGEQGAAKSTTARVLRRLVDPASPELRREPRESRDLMVAARHGWLIVLDNLSHLQPWLSDCLCRLSTGDGQGERELYTNRDEVLFEACRPVILNGISDFATRGDLLDRAIQIELPAIAPTARLAEGEFWREFEQARPGILGALLDSVCAGLRELPSVRLAQLPRMADFARFAVACERGAGEARQFLAAYEQRRTEDQIAAIDSSPVGAALDRWLQLHAELPWTGTAGELLDKLSALVDTATLRAPFWPKSPRALAGDLRRLAPAFRGCGIEIRFYKTTDRSRVRMVAIERL